MFIRESVDLLILGASILTTVGAIFLLRSIVAMDAKEIASLAGTYIGRNQHIESSYVTLRSDTLLGFILTLLGGLSASASTLINWQVRLSKESFLIIAFSITLFFLLLHFLSKVLRSRLGVRTAAVSFSFHVQSYLRNPNQFKADRILQTATHMGLSSMINESLSDHKNIANILIFAGANPGAEEVLKLEK